MITRPPLSEKQAEQRAELILADLAGLDSGDTLRVIHAALGKIILRRIPEGGAPVLALPGADNPFLKRRRGASRIAKDGELREFINAQTQYLTIDQICSACINEFGQERTPSRSAIHRYLKRF